MRARATIVEHHERHMPRQVPRCATSQPWVGFPHVPSRGTRSEGSPPRFHPSGPSAKVCCELRWACTLQPMKEWERRQDHSNGAPLNRDDIWHSLSRHDGLQQSLCIVDVGLALCQLADPIIDVARPCLPMVLHVTYSLRHDIRCRTLTPSPSGQPTSQLLVNDGARGRGP